MDNFIQDSIGILSGKLLNMTNKNLVDSTGQFLSKGLCPLERGYNEVDTENSIHLSMFFLGVEQHLCITGKCYTV